VGVYEVPILDAEGLERFIPTMSCPNKPDFLRYGVAARSRPISPRKLESRVEIKVELKRLRRLQIHHGSE
jgi:hypothetical protein